LIEKYTKKKNPHKILQTQGFEFEQSCQTGQHVITRVDVNSAAYHNLEIGDEIVAVNHRPCLSWDYRKVQTLVRDKTSETTVVLFVKRKPKHGRDMYDIYVRPSRTPRRKLIARVVEESEAGMW
jgi:predicted metalloprotease with PDZ domain